MSKDYSSLFVNNEVKEWFCLSDKYKNLEVGFKKELPAKYMLGFYSKQKEANNLKSIKNKNKREEKTIEIELAIYECARRCLENLVDKDLNRVLTDDILENQLSIHETIQHFQNIMKDKQEALKEEIKK